jgi:hypothetical protein
LQSLREHLDDLEFTIILIFLSISKIQGDGKREKFYTKIEILKENVFKLKYALKWCNNYLISVFQQVIMYGFGVKVLHHVFVK